MPSIMYKVRALTEDMIRRTGKEFHLDAEKARRLEKKGLVKIICAIESEPRKVVIQAKGDNKIELMEPKKHGEGLAIPLIIPYASCGRIAYAYNEAMQSYVKDWVLFTDHDILLINPLWYDICMNAINKYGHEVGWFTCYTNRIKCKYQIAPGVNSKSDDMKYHRTFAKNLYDKNKGKVKDVTNASGGKFSGLFILTHKEAWERVGGFNENIGFFGVDTYYFSKLKQFGYKLMVLQDLYVYHGYFREVKKPYFTKELYTYVEK